MGRAQIKKKSTFIDMTAMSDVTVLLLTFFMLTSTFVKKEPVQVNTPASVSEIKIPETNVLQILVDPNGKIFMSPRQTAGYAGCFGEHGERVWHQVYSPNRRSGLHWLQLSECLSEVCRNTWICLKNNGTRFSK